MMSDFERLEKEVEYWKKLYFEEKAMTERLSLDLGFKNQDFVINQEKINEEDKQNPKNQGSTT